MSETRPPGPAADRMQKVLLHRWEERLGAAAVRAAFIEERQLEEALLERDRTGGERTLGRIFLERGWMTPEDIEELSEHLKQTELFKPAPPALLPPEAQEALADPLRLLGPFVLVAKLGSGGAAEVWKAWDRVLGRWVAVKLPRFPPESRTARERFQREAHAAAKLTHPNIIPIYTVSEETDRPYFVMQYVEGRTLAGEKRDPRQAAELLQTLARAVHYAHAQGVIHRDIKPGNLLLDKDGRPWIFDFGLVFLSEEARHLTVPGTVVGTPAYMSPEQAQGGDQAHGPEADVYGLGATLYELATGQPPFTGSSLADILLQVKTADPPLPRKLDPGLDPGLERIILKSMDKDPRRRYPTAGEFSEDLGRFLAGEPVLAPAPSRWLRIRKRMRKHRTLLLTGAAALAFSGALGIRIGRGVAAPPSPPPGVEQAAAPIVLGPDNAVLHGPTLAIYDTGARRHVAGWSSPDCSLEWFVNAPKAGWYKAELTYATGLNNGGKYCLKTEREEWTGNIASTGSWDTYRTVPLGTIHLPLEKSRLSLRAQEVFGGLMDFKELRLTLER